MSRNSSAARLTHILYIGREDPGYEKVWQAIGQEGANVVFARTQTMGLDLARRLQPAIVVINPLNSHFSGERLCRELKRRLPQARRVLICDRSENQHIECEDRLVRPFTPRRLRETMGKALSSLAPPVLKAGPIELNLTTRVVKSPQGQARLTPKQCELLATFLQRPNQVISRESLMSDIWETHYLGDTRTLDVHIHWLREKIEEDPTRPGLLVTVRGVGYRLVIAPSAARAARQADQQLQM